MLIADISWLRLAAGVAAILVVLFARFISVGVPMVALRPQASSSRRALPLMAWAGLRGAIPVALALSLPNGENRDLIVTITYIVVVFSVLVQGGTVKYLVPRIRSERGSPASEPPKES